MGFVASVNGTDGGNYTTNTQHITCDSRLRILLGSKKGTCGTRYRGNAKNRCIAAVTVTVVTLRVKLELYERRIVLRLAFLFHYFIITLFCNFRNLWHFLLF